MGAMGVPGGGGLEHAGGTEEGLLVEGGGEELEADGEGIGVGG